MAVEIPQILKTHRKLGRKLKGRLGLEGNGQL